LNEADGFIEAVVKLVPDSYDALPFVIRVRWVANVSADRYFAVRIWQDCSSGGQGKGEIHPIIDNSLGL